MPAVCQMIQDGKHHEFFTGGYTKLILNEATSELYYFETRDEAMGYTGADADSVFLYTGQMEEKWGSHRTYANPSLDAAKDSRGLATVYTLRNDVITKADKYRREYKNFDLKVERRDYDSDYDGVFFRLHGYVVKDKATYVCSLQE